MHLLFALCLTLLIYTGFSATKDGVPGVIDWLFVAGSIASIGYMFYEYEYFISRFATVDDLRPADWVLGIMLVVIVLEAARRVLGAALSLTSRAFIAYALLYTGLKPQMMLDQVYMTLDGIFGIPMSDSATYVMRFIIFGAFF